MENNNLIIIIISFIVGYLVSNNSMCRLIEGSSEPNVCDIMQINLKEFPCHYCDDNNKDSPACARKNCSQIDLVQDPCNDCHWTNQYSDACIKFKQDKSDEKIQQDWEDAGCKYVPDKNDNGVFDSNNSKCGSSVCSAPYSPLKSNGFHYRYGDCDSDSDSCSIM